MIYKSKSSILYQKYKLAGILDLLNKLMVQQNMAFSEKKNLILLNCNFTFTY